VSEILAIKSYFSENRSDLAWDNYKDVVLELSKNKRVLEIGSGRSPLFSEEEIKNNNIDFYANDISDKELKKAPLKCPKVVFDICGEIPKEFYGKFDFIFSKMVLEHVPDGKKYWENVCTLSRPEAVCLTFHPTLFSPPFVLNYILPEALSARLLRLFFPERNEDESPKFPAKYSYCFSTKRILEKIKSLGFQEVDNIPFYFHGYFKKIPLVNFIDRAFSSLSMRRDLRFFSSFAYTITKK